MKTDHISVNTMTVFATVAALSIFGVIGCGKTHSPVKNTERVLTKWEKKEAEIVKCLEFSTASSKLNNLSFELAAGKIGATDVPGISFANAESLANIYEVADIIQYGHAAMYRLCEAQANGFFKDFDENQIIEMYDEVGDNVREILMIKYGGEVGVSAVATLKLTNKMSKIDKTISKLIDLYGKTTDPDVKASIALAIEAVAKYMAHASDFFNHANAPRPQKTPTPAPSPSPTPTPTTGTP